MPRILRTSRDILTSDAGNAAYDTHREHLRTTAAFGASGTTLGAQLPRTRRGTGASGPLVCDIFVGSTVATAPHIIRLPHQVRLTVVPEVVAREGIEELLFHPAQVRPAPPALDYGDVARELTTYLQAESERIALGEAKVLTRRIEQRLIIRQGIQGSSAEAHSLHIRLLPSRAVPRRAGPRVPLPFLEEPAALRTRRHLPRTRHRAHAVPVPARSGFAAGDAGGPVRERRRRDARARPQRSAQPCGQARAQRSAQRFGRAWAVPPGAFREGIRVAVVTLSVAALVGALASIGTLGTVAREVRLTATRGAIALRSGYGSLVAKEARATPSDFSEARSAFAEAAAQLTESTSVIQRLVAKLDPAGRYPAAQTLLAAGARAADAGERAADLARRFRESPQPLTETIEGIVPDLTRLYEELRGISTALAGLRLSGFPAEDARAVSSLTGGLQVFEKSLAAFLQSQTVLLELLGSRQDRQYLVLFQNHQELRPTGGFIGSFALVDVSRGEVRKIHVDTIYNPDGQLKDFLVPPKPLQKITDRWYARDGNWFADFRTSAQKVAHLFERSGGPTVDGVIALTPPILEDLLRITGPIPMPDYGVTVTAANVVEKTQHFVTYAYDRAENTPKAFIADLIPEVLARVAVLPRERWGDLVNVLSSALEQKHLLLFFRNEEAENAVVTLGWGGTLPEPPLATPGILADHLGRVEANIGGHKTDALVEQTVDYDVTIGSDGSFTATLVVTRHHRGPKGGTPGVPRPAKLGVGGTPGLPPDEDPARKTNIVYERTFVPVGSRLIEARGFTPPDRVPAPFQGTPDYRTFDRDPDLAVLEEGAEMREGDIVLATESGFTTLGGWVITPPEETTVTVLRYRLPYVLPRPSLLASILRYELLQTKQPGHLPALTRATLHVPFGFRLAWTEPRSGVSLASERKATYTGLLNRDLLWGAVIEEQ